MFICEHVKRKERVKQSIAKELDIGKEENKEIDAKKLDESTMVVYIIASCAEFQDSITIK